MTQGKLYHISYKQIFMMALLVIQKNNLNIICNI